MTFIDVLFHDGTTGPIGCPMRAIQYRPGTEPQEPPDGMVRLSIEEYRAAEPVWQRALEAWAAQHPVPLPPEPLPPLTAVQFLALASQVLALNPETVEDDLIALIKQHVSDPRERAEAIIAVKRATVFEPDHPLLRSLAAAAGIDAPTFEAAWRAAAP